MIIRMLLSSYEFLLMIQVLFYDMHLITVTICNKFLYIYLICCNTLYCFALYHTISFHYLQFSIFYVPLFISLIYKAMVILTEFYVIATIISIVNGIMLKQKHTIYTVLVHCIPLSTTIY